MFLVTHIDLVRGHFEPRNDRVHADDNDVGDSDNLNRDGSGDPGAFNTRLRVLDYVPVEGVDWKRKVLFLCEF